MKKWITAVLAALLALSVSAAFVACGDGETPGGDGGNGGNTDTKSYTVTKTESDLYDYGWSTTTATAGTAAYVEVTPEYEAVSIAAVYYNGQACTKDAENEERYNFTSRTERRTIISSRGIRRTKRPYCRGRVRRSLPLRRIGATRAF